MVLYFLPVGRIRKGLEHRNVIFPHPGAVVLNIQGIVGIGVDPIYGIVYFYFNIAIVERRGN